MSKNTKTVLELDKRPAVVPSFIRALTKFGGGLDDGATIPDLEAEVEGVVVDRKNLAAYCEVCGFADSETLPVTYPHVLAFPMHMAVLTHRAFPLRLLGLVHTRNAITQHRAIGAGESLDMKVRVGGHRSMHNGIEFDLVTEIYGVDGDTVWESTSTMLARGKGSGQRSGKRKRAQDNGPENGRYGSWKVPVDIGRRYAWVAGDVNPIHMSALSAKLFGFPRAIAHGMWLKARSAAELGEALASEAYRIEVTFKRPVLLPSPVLLKYDAGKAGIEFVLTNPDGDAIHLRGSIEYL